MVRMMGMMKLRCVNHVAGLGILAPRRLRDLDAARAGYNRRLVVVLCTPRFFDAIFFLLLHFRFRFLHIYIHIMSRFRFNDRKANLIVRFRDDSILGESSFNNFSIQRTSLKTIEILKRNNV